MSTAYVASTHQGEAKEELLSENRFTLDVDWEDEVEAARRLRDDLQAASRQPDRLTAFTKEARGEIGGAGDHLIATRAEKIREEWVRTELVEAGTARALSLGLAGCLPLHQGHGRAGPRRAVGRQSPDHLRPALHHRVRAGWSPGPVGSGASGWPSRSSCPTPGACCVSSPAYPKASSTSSRSTWWWRPSSPSPPTARTPTGPSVFHVASGVRNPLPYGHLVDLAEDWFSRNPLYDERGQPISVPEWSFPGRGGCSASCAGPIRS